jgi:hypothetical protein
VEELSELPNCRTAELFNPETIGTPTSQWKPPGALRSTLDVFDANGNSVENGIYFPTDHTFPRQSAPMTAMGNTVYIDWRGVVYGLTLE